MRYFLDAVYRGAAVLAALCLIALLGTVLLTVVGRELGWYLIVVDGYAGYFMAGTGFLALAHTLQHHQHVRVTLLLDAVQGRARYHVRVMAMAIGALLSLLLAYYSVRLVTQSLALRDISTSMDATPLWIPQLAMATGTVIFCIAVFDQLWQALQEYRPQDT